MKMKKVLCLGLAGVTAFSMLAFTGCGSDSGDSSEAKDTNFSWWITTDDGKGTYYDDYADNPGVQWLNQQYWDVENGGLGTEENGTNIQFTFQTPISGSESDNFQTMMSTESYTDIIDLAYSTDNAETLYENGMILDLTEYVEEYMPNYLAFLEANPDEAAQVTSTDEDGNVHYYQLARIKDGNDVPWGGYVYRRDWVVEYAEPTSHVWDWDSDYVKENGHPAVTPLEAALESGNMEGWKENDVKEFTSSEGEDPNNDYTDNVIFPSGTSDPLTISDWEWMFEAFSKALEDKGFSGNSDAYCTTLYYPGFLATGDLVSSFGGGTGSISKDADNNAYDSATTENFRTYLEAMNTWYNNGWLDTRFNERASDIFFRINENGTAQGMVGLWYSGQGNLGTTIRVTCADAEDQQKAYVMPCACPINDVYGTEDQMYKEPDSFYQGSRISGRTAVTKAAEDKDLAALCTFFDWLYTDEGARTLCWGLTSEQLASADIENNLYEENNIDGAYTTSTDENGGTVYTMNYDMSADIGNALHFGRLIVGKEMTGAGADLDYTLVRGNTMIVDKSVQEWTRYTSTGSVIDYNSLMTEEENAEYSSLFTPLNEYMSQNVPTLIKEGLGGWDEFVDDIQNTYHDADLVAIYQAIFDRLFR